MPEIISADAASDLALIFAKKARIFAMPVSARREDDIWIVEVDLGLFESRIGNVRVDAKTGRILDYQFPPFSKAS